MDVIKVMLSLSLSHAASRGRSVHLVTSAGGWRARVLSVASTAAAEIMEHLEASRSQSPHVSHEPHRPNGERLGLIISTT